MTQISHDLDSALAQINDLETKIQQSQTSYAQLDKANTLLKESYNVSQLQVESLISQQLLELEAAHQSSEREGEDQQNELIQARYTIAEMTTEAQSLRDQILTVQEENRDVSQKLQEFEEQFDEVRAQFENEIAAMNGQIGSQLVDIKDLQEHV